MDLGFVSIGDYTSRKRKIVSAKGLAAVWDSGQAMTKFARYFFAGMLLWIVVDYTTAFNPNTQEWFRHMPLICAFYVGYPLLFATVIYRKHWTPRRVFGLMVLTTLVMEIAFFGNALLFTFPVMLIMIPLALAVYSLLTYLPLWIVEHQLKENRKKAMVLLAIWIVIAILSFKTRIQS